MEPKILDKILNRDASVRKFHHLELDAHLVITNIFGQVYKFADCPDEVILGNDVRLGFPELIGLEDIIADILMNKQDLFELKGIARYLEDGKLTYIDLYIVANQHDNWQHNQLFMLIEDVTDRMIIEQNIVQKINEANLLASTLAAYKDCMEKIIISMADALIVTTKSGRITRVNLAAEKLFGYEQEELINQPISLLLDDNKLLQTAVKKEWLLNKYFQNTEVVCRHKNREKLLISFSCALISSEIEGLEDFVYIGRDITAQQRSQQRQALQYSINRTLSEATSLPEAMPQILQAIVEILGWDVGELWTPNQYLSMPLSGSSLNPVLRCVEMWSNRTVAIQEFQAITWQTTFTTGEGVPGQVWATRSPQWISNIEDSEQFLRRSSAIASGLHTAFGFPILDDTEILGVIVFFSREVQPFDEDITQIMLTIGSQIAQFIKRKSAEAALQESEARYRDLFENANDLIQSVGINGQFLYVNRAWRKALGYAEAEIFQLNAFDIVHPDYKAHCQRLFHQVMAGKKVDELKTAFITKDGETIFVEGNINCKFVDGKPVATRGIFRNITQRVAVEAALHQQQKQTERLLLNILPEVVVERLKQSHATIAEDFADVTVLFADIVGFTPIAGALSAIELVNILNEIFSAFDRLSEQYGLEKIKTIGDAYMVVGGLPIRRDDHASAIAQMALDMQKAITDFNLRHSQQTDKYPPLQLRLGIHTGPVVAGVIGIKKFSYDLWGDTVNIASRMESQGIAGRIQVTQDTYERLRDGYLFEKRGEIEVKGKGEMTTYFLLGRG